MEIKRAYIRAGLAEPAFASRVFYSLSGGTRDYVPITLVTIASAITEVRSRQDYKASVYIDGLKRPEYRAIGTGLRRIGVSTEKVRGVTDESSPFIRLADAVAGLVREAKEGRSYAAILCEEARRSGFLKEV